MKFPSVARPTSSPTRIPPSTDVPTILLSYGLMFLYVTVALSRVEKGRSLLHTSSITLAVAGILLVVFALVCSVGVFAALGVKATLIIAEVIPFLVLAVGVDNIFIMVHAMRRTTSLNPQQSVEARVAATMAEVGPSILLSALSETVAFGIGGLAKMPAIRCVSRGAVPATPLPALRALPPSPPLPPLPPLARAFALYACLAIFINFLMQITSFVAVLTLDVMRRERGAYDLICCVKSKNTKVGAKRSRGIPREAHPTHPVVPL